MDLAKRSVSEITMALQHICIGKSYCVYHGSHCIWCSIGKRKSAVPRDLNHGDAVYLHPEPDFLHSSNRFKQCGRKWLLVQTHNDRTAYSNLKRWQKGYVSKYAFDISVEISDDCTSYSPNNITRCLKWLTRGFHRTIMITLVEKLKEEQTFLNSTFWKDISLFSCHVPEEQPLWIVLDYFGQYREARVGLRYAYTFSEAGHSQVNVHVSPLPSCVLTLLILYLRKTPSYVERNGSMYDTLWQNTLHEVIVGQQGHRSIHEILDAVFRLLRPFGLVPVLETNRLLEIKECFFSYEVLFEAVKVDGFPTPIAMLTSPHPSICPKEPDESVF
jgi:hypothetical protein